MVGQPNNNNKKTIRQSNFCSCLYRLSAKRIGAEADHSQNNYYYKFVNNRLVVSCLGYSGYFTVPCLLYLDPLDAHNKEKRVKSFNERYRDGKKQQGTRCWWPCPYLATVWANALTCCHTQTSNLILLLVTEGEICTQKVFGYAVFWTWWTGSAYHHI